MVGVIYNTCGIGRSNPEMYARGIECLLAQTCPGAKVALSSCLNPPAVREHLRSRFGDRISYVWIDEREAVNVTFNLSCRLMKDAFPDIDRFVYVSSDIMLEDCGAVARLNEVMNTGRYAIAYAAVDRDSGYRLCLGFETLPDVEVFEVPVGCSANGHIAMYSIDIYREFGSRVLPDVFVSWCTETIFSFMAAAVSKRMGIVPGARATHVTSGDGASSGHGGAHSLVHAKARYTIDEILDDPRAFEVGLGYEEFVASGRLPPNSRPWRYLLHNPSAYDEAGACRDPRALADYILEHFFLRQEDFDYAALSHTFFKGAV